MAKPLLGFLVTETREYYRSPRQALIDPQTEGGFALGIHHLPQPWVVVMEVSLACELKPLGSRGLLIIGCHSQIRPTDTHKEIEAAP